MNKIVHSIRLTKAISIDNIYFRIGETLNIECFMTKSFSSLLCIVSNKNKTPLEYSSNVGDINDDLYTRTDKK